MPLTSIQERVLKVLAAHRDPESYVAGGTPLNHSGGRYSRDIDIFHDREDRVEGAASKDATALEEEGYTVDWVRRYPAIHSAKVSIDGQSTHLEWVADSDFRFFPAVRDETFGYILHPVDLGLNKTSAAAGRREVRDIVDLVVVHETILAVGALVWAAVEKAPGYTPEGLIAEIRRNSNYPRDEWRAISSSVPLDPIDVTARLRRALDDADAFVARMPTEKAGLLFLENGRVVQPDPARLDSYQAHEGRRRGHWPTNAEITSALLERYGIT